MNAQSSVTLVQNGDVRFALEIDPPQDGEAIAEAIEALRDHLEICIGTPIPWWDRRADEQPPVRLVLHLDPMAELGVEAFTLEVAENAVRLHTATPTGMVHAVHHLLEAAFGVRWLWPGETGTVLPPARDVTLPVGVTRHEPDWQWRRLFMGGAFWKESDLYLAMHRFGGISADTFAQWRLWQRRMRLGGLNIADGHRWCQICSPLVYGQTHPEYFALVNGKRDTEYYDGKHKNQPCTANADVIRLTADHIKAQFRARPDLDGFSIAVNDGYGFCECDDCRAVDAWAESQTHDADSFDDAVAEGGAENAVGEQSALTDRMLLFANQVAELVEQDYPDKLLLTLIYSLYRTPPRRVRLRKNLIAQFCSMTWSHAVDDIREKDMTAFTGLGGFAQTLGLYDYYVNGAAGTMPRGMSRTLDRSLRDYYKGGARYFATQAGLDFAIDGFKYFFTARLLWDVDVTVDEVLGDFCAAGFGKAGDAVKSYLKAYMDQWDSLLPAHADLQTSMEALTRVMYPAAWRADRRAELDEAARLCGDDAAARVAFLSEGLDFLDLFADACEAVRDDGPGGDAVRSLLQWVDAHHDGFWIDSTWFKYQRQTRRGKLRI